MQIRLHKRALDGKVEVWAEMVVTWGAQCPVKLTGREIEEADVSGSYERELGFETTEPVLVEVLDGNGERSRFLAERRDSAPLWAGDGFGASSVS